VIPTKPFTSEVLDKPAEFGVLKELEGTWVSYVGKTGYGIHTTCMPSPGSTADMIPGKFHFLCEDYTEEMKFTLIEGGVRNRAGANEQMIGAVKYEQTIKNRKEKKGIHEEVGMYLYLGDMYKHDATEESVKKDLGLPELKPGDGGFLLSQPIPSVVVEPFLMVTAFYYLAVIGSEEENLNGHLVWLPGKRTTLPFPDRWDSIPSIQKLSSTSINQHLLGCVILPYPTEIPAEILPILSAF
jgi:hypothetical protein